MAEEKKRPEAALHDSLPVIRNDAVVKQKEGATAPQKGDGYIALRELLAKSFTPEEIAEVDGAYALARQSHEGQHTLFRRALYHPPDLRSAHPCGDGDG